MSKQLILVDDDAFMRRSLAFNLEQAGYRTSSAVDVEDALALAQWNPPDLVLLDISLPGMDGRDALGNCTAPARNWRNLELVLEARVVGYACVAAVLETETTVLPAQNQLSH